MDLREYIRTYLQTIDSELDVRENSIYDELYINPTAYLGSAFFESLVLINAAMAPTTPADTFSSDELEMLAKKSFIYRTPSARSYGLVRIYYSDRQSIDLRSATFTTSDGYTISPDNGVVVSGNELRENSYGYYYEFLGYSDDGVNISANTINDSSLTGWIRLENDAFSGGTQRMTDTELMELYQNSYIYQENFLYARSIRNLILSKYPDIVKTFVAGRNDSEMIRDVILNLDSVNGTAAIARSLPTDVDALFTYDTTIKTSDISTYLSSTLPSKQLLDDELQYITLNDNDDYTFTRGLLMKMSHDIYSLYDGGEYDADNVRLSTPSQVLVDTYTNPSTITLSHDMLRTSKLDSLGYVGQTMDVPSDTDILYNITINPATLNNRFIYMGLTDIDSASAFKYYSTLGFVVKPSSTAGEYNIFLVNKMVHSYGDIVVGDVSLNIGDNMSDESTPAYTYGRPYLAAAHYDINLGGSYSFTLKFTYHTDSGTGNTLYDMELIDAATQTSIMSYNNLYLQSQTLYNRMYVGVSDAKLPPDISTPTSNDYGFNVNITAMSAELDIPAGNTNYYMALCYTLDYPDTDNNNAYKELVINIIRDTTSPGFDGIYLAASNSGSYTVTDISSTATIMDVNQTTRTIKKIAYTTTDLKDYVGDDNKLHIILASNQLAEYPLNSINVLLQKTGIHGGNMLDVYVSSAPVQKTITVDSDANGNIQLATFGRSNLPVLYIASVVDSSSQSIDYLLEYDPADETSYCLRYSVREGGVSGNAPYRAYISTGTSGVASYTITYYTNEYVSLIQDLADDDYYKDVLSDVLIKSAIPIRISNITFSVNKGYTDDGTAKSALVDYINQNPDTLTANELENVLLQNGATSANIESISYQILYPEFPFPSSTVITSIPATISSADLSNIAGDLYNRNKAFMAFPGDSGFTLTLE